MSETLDAAEGCIGHGHMVAGEEGYCRVVSVEAEVEVPCKDPAAATEDMHNILQSYCRMVRQTGSVGASILETVQIDLTRATCLQQATYFWENNYWNRFDLTLDLEIGLAEATNLKQAT